MEGIIMGKWSKKARETQAARMKMYWKSKRQHKEITSTPVLSEGGMLGSDTIVEKLNDIKAIVGEIQTLIGG